MRFKISMPGINKSEEWIDEKNVNLSGEYFITGIIYKYTPSVIIAFIFSWFLNQFLVSWKLCNVPLKLGFRSHTYFNNAL